MTSCTASVVDVAVHAGAVELSTDGHLLAVVARRQVAMFTSIGAASPSAIDGNAVGLADWSTLTAFLAARVLAVMTSRRHHVPRPDAGRGIEMLVVLSASIR